ncbi:SUMF1/EgtB/PvdO family nonheme iron enzyme [Thiolinea disciformis]|uniref:SUMF1/EgtB/PvdO family nonheme iron enzyme n=1 Tax=Thiolinea disciformis TaxID=125614 RepID=UPI00035C758E|nr:SUMF1/EgtB/PvdO family nonheme iron enzyme [Thiolinea disciformis]
MTDIFISYSHKDEAWKDALKQQLKALQLHANFEIWDDGQIQAGSDWLSTIKNAIAQARVVILLVSSDFLASEFVTKQEIPEFLKRREKEGLRIVPVIVRPCVWWTIPWLAAIQGASKDNKPLSQYPLGSYELEIAFSDITGKVYDLLQEAKQIAAQKQAEEKHQIQQVVEQTVLSNPLNIEQQRLKQQRIDTLSHKISELYAVHDLETRIEEKLRLQHLIAETERSLAGLITNEFTPPVPPQPDTRYKQPIQVQQKDEQSKSFGVRNTRSANLNKWWLGVVILTVLGAAGVWWYNHYKSLPTISDQGSASVGETPVSEARLPFEPEMVAIPAGSFTMGCLPKREMVKSCPENESPAHEVKVDAFQMGKYEVTFDEWDVCEQSNVCPHADDNGWGRGRRPVIDVSWDDVQIYLRWLTQQTGKRYRLPTEEEWEYAARSNQIQDNYISCSHGGCDYLKKTGEVGAYEPNAFGLYDMLGNVAEWTSNLYTENYKTSTQGWADVHVIRGGSNISINNANGLLTTRVGDGLKYSFLGFRLAHDL